MKKTFVFALLSVLSCSAQIELPEGTKIRVRLEQAISSATAEEGQLVEMSVTDAVRVGDAVVIAEGASVTGTVTEAHEKRRMGRAGKLDFSIDRVKTVDNRWVPLRYGQQEIRTEPRCELRHPDCRRGGGILASGSIDASPKGPGHHD